MLYKTMETIEEQYVHENMKSYITEKSVSDETNFNNKYVRHNWKKKQKTLTLTKEQF